MPATSAVMFQRALCFVGERTWQEVWEQQTLIMKTHSAQVCWVRHKAGWFIFGGIEARYRFNDITIEGDRPGVVDYAQRKTVKTEHL